MTCWFLTFTCHGQAQLDFPFLVALSGKVSSVSKGIRDPAVHLL